MQTRCGTWKDIMRGMVVLALPAICSLRGFACQAAAKNDPPKPLPKEIVEAWKEAGAVVGWMPADRRDFLKPPTEGEPGDLPAFEFSTRHFMGFPWEEGLLAKLPAPAAAFGLDLGFTEVTDAGLKELAGLRNLQALNLFGTPVTDAGLKELAALKNLQTLNLARTQVTDAGLKELAALENLQWLGLRETEVTGPGLKELARLKNLHSLNLESTQVTDAGLKELAGLKSLQSLDFRFTQVTDVGLKQLAGLKSLQSLVLCGYQITDAGLKELARLKNLQTLYLENTEVTDAGLTELAGLKNLQTLYLGNAKVTDAGLKELAGLTNLQALSLSGTQVTDAGLNELAVFKRLQEVNLNVTKVTDVGLKQLAGLKLKTLTISRSALTDLGLKHYLAAIEPPTTLDLNKTKVTDAGLKALAGLESLQTLDLGETKVTDAGLKALAGLRNLQTLNLLITRVTDVGLKELAGLKRLQKLDLGYTFVTDAGLKELAGLKNLQTLALYRTKVTDAGLKDLAGLESLQTLNLRQTQVTDAGLKAVGGLKSLQTLDLNGTNVTDGGLKELAGLWTLKILYLPARVTDAGLRELAGLNSLQKLDLRGADVTDAGLEGLQKALPGCRILSARVNEAEKLFRAMEKKIKAADAVQLTFDIELRAIKGREKESKINKVSKANGFLLITKDDKARLKISGEYVGMEMVSNGKQMKWATEEGLGGLRPEVWSIDQAKAVPAPKGLHGLLWLVSRDGVTATRLSMPFLLKYGAIGPGDENDEKNKLRDFKAGAAEKVGGRDAKVVSYKYGKGDKGALPVTVWLDAKTLLPLKRVIVISNENLHITETYTEFKLDPKVDAKAFELIPAQGNEAEKLFRAMEEKIKAAKAVQVTFDIEMKGKGEQGNLKGSVLFTKDNKARLKLSGKEIGKPVTIEMISDGKRMKIEVSGGTFPWSDEGQTRTNLHSLLSAMVSGPGVLLTD